MKTNIDVEYFLISRLSEYAKHMKCTPGYYKVRLFFILDLNRRQSHTYYIGSGNVSDLIHLLSTCMEILPRCIERNKQYEDLNLDKLLLQETRELYADFEDVLFVPKELGESIENYRSRSVFELEDNYKSFSLDFNTGANHVETFTSTIGFSEKEASQKITKSLAMQLSKFMVESITYKDMEELTEGKVGVNPFELYMT